MPCRRRRRAQGARLRHDGDERGLPDEAALAAHVGAGDHERARSPLRAPPALPLAPPALPVALSAAGASGRRAPPPPSAPAGGAPGRGAGAAPPRRQQSLGTMGASVASASSTGCRPASITSCCGSCSPANSGRTYLRRGRQGGASLAGRSGALLGPMTAVTGCFEILRRSGNSSRRSSRNSIRSGPISS